jgi:hypothetical protein
MITLGSKKERFLKRPCTLTFDLPRVVPQFEQTQGVQSPFWRQRVVDERRTVIGVSGGKRPAAGDG